MNTTRTLYVFLNNSRGFKSRKLYDKIYGRDVFQCLHKAKEKGYNNKSLYTLSW